MQELWAWRNSHCLTVAQQEEPGINNLKPPLPHSNQLLLLPTGQLQLGARSPGTWVMHFREVIPLGRSVAEKGRGCKWKGQQKRSAPCIFLYAFVMQLERPGIMRSPL